MDVNADNWRTVAADAPPRIVPPSLASEVAEASRVVAYYRRLRTGQVPLALASDLTMARFAPAVEIVATTTPR